MTDRIIQICNITPPRRGFDNPQEGRVYSIEGIAPCIRNDSRFYIVVYEEGEYEDKQIVQHLRLHGWQLCRECVRNRRSEPHHQHNGGGNREPLIVTDMKEATQQDLFAGMDCANESLIDFSCADIEELDGGGLELPPELIGKRFRIRKLTEREVFRLMGVDDKSIDKIQAAGISMTGQYHLAGNSIVVDVLFHLFRKMFIETDADIEPREQMSLF